eukprot:267254_1
MCLQILSHMRCKVLFQEKRSPICSQQPISSTTRLVMDTNNSVKHKLLMQVKKCNEWKGNNNGVTSSVSCNKFAVTCCLCIEVQPMIKYFVSVAGVSRKKKKK